MTTPREVNKALKAAGIAATIYRNLRGGSYYYFSADREIRSIYSYSLASWTTPAVVAYVQRELATRESSE